MNSATMKRKTFIFLLMTVGLVVFFPMTGKESFRQEDQVFKTTQSFFFGFAIGESGDSDASSNHRCDVLDRSYRYFCEEGLSASFFLRRQGGLTERLQAWRGKFNAPTAFNVLGLGIGLAKVELWRPNATTAVDDALSPALTLTVVNGWSFGRVVFERDDLRSTIRECAQFFRQDLRKACLFGVGRASVFNGSSDSVRAGIGFDVAFDTERPVLVGLGFAEAFAKRISLETLQGDRASGRLERQRAIERGFRLAELFRARLEQRTVSSADRDLAECVAVSLQKPLGLMACF